MSRSGLATGDSDRKGEAETRVPYSSLKWRDRESLLGDYGVRKYDADIGRFLSVDKLFESQPGYSPYHYAGNDPVNASDPSGLFQMTAFGGTRITDVSMGDFEQGYSRDFNSWGSTSSVAVEYNSNPDPLTPGTRMMPIHTSFAASSGGGLFYHGSTPSLMNRVYQSGVASSDATSVAPHVIRDVSGALAGFDSGRGSYRDPIQMAPVLVTGERVQVLPAMSDLDYFVNVTLAGQGRSTAIGGWLYEVDQQGYSTGRIAAVTGVAPTPAIGRASTVANTARFAPGQWLSHFQKHMSEFNFKTAVEYLKGARQLFAGGAGVRTFVRSNGDKLFYRASTNEFGVLARDGITIKTYFKPSSGFNYWRKLTGGR